MCQKFVVMSLKTKKYPKLIKGRKRFAYSRRVECRMSEREHVTKICI